MEKHNKCRCFIQVFCRVKLSYYNLTMLCGMLTYAEQTRADHNCCTNKAKKKNSLSDIDSVDCWGIDFRGASQRDRSIGKCFYRKCD